eukprot:gene10699-2798_t
MQAAYHSPVLQNRRFAQQSGRTDSSGPSNTSLATLHRQSNGHVTSASSMSARPLDATPVSSLVGTPNPGGVPSTPATPATPGKPDVTKGFHSVTSVPVAGSKQDHEKALMKELMRCSFNLLSPEDKPTFINVAKLVDRLYRALLALSKKITEEGVTSELSDQFRRVRERLHQMDQQRKDLLLKVSIEDLPQVLHPIRKKLQNDPAKSFLGKLQNTGSTSVVTGSTQLTPEVLKAHQQKLIQQEQLQQNIGFMQQGQSQSILTSHADNAASLSQPLPIKTPSTMAHHMNLKNSSSSSSASHSNLAARTNSSQAYSNISRTAHLVLSDQPKRQQMLLSLKPSDRARVEALLHRLQQQQQMQQKQVVVD